MDATRSELNVNTVLQGAWDPAFKVGVRWGCYMNRKMSYQNVDGTGFDSGLPATWAMEAAADSRNFKIALLAAIMIHILLLWVVFPAGDGPGNGATSDIKPKVRVFYKIPPKDRLEPLVIHDPVRLVPVPDPTPADPEPMVSVDAITVPDVPDDNFYYDSTIPERKTVEEWTEGLVKPVYDMAELQQNVTYPLLGVKAGLEGYVIVQAVLNQDGTVSDVHVIGGNLAGFGFPEAAKSAVRKLEFVPGLFEGHPVNVVMNLTIHFRLRR